MTDSGYYCPIDPTHGRLVLLDTNTDKAYYCPHSAHSGRPKSHPLGATPATNAIFNFGQVDPTWKLGIVKQAKAAHIAKKRARKHC